MQWIIFLFFIVFIRNESIYLKKTSNAIKYPMSFQKRKKFFVDCSGQEFQHFISLWSRSKVSNNLNISILFSSSTISRFTCTITATSSRASQIAVLVLIISIIISTSSHIVRVTVIVVIFTRWHSLLFWKIWSAWTSISCTIRISVHSTSIVHGSSWTVAVVSSIIHASSCSSQKGDCDGNKYQLKVHFNKW